MKLVVQSGSQAGQSVDLVKDVIAIGRGADSDLMLADNAVSRRHCQIRREPSGWVIYDLGGVNGTRINGERIARPRPLREGDTITLGQTTVRVEPGEPQTMPRQPVIAEMPPQYAPAPRSSNVGLWVAIGIVVFLFALVGGLALFYLATSTPTASPKIQIPTTTLIAVAPTLAPTPVPPVTMQATPALTATVAVAPVALTATPTGSGEKTRTPIPSVTPSPTPDKSFPAVSLLKPKEKETISTSDAVEFNWTTAGVLRQADMYRLQIIVPGPGFDPSAPNFDDPFKAIPVCEIRTRESNIAVTGKSQDCNDRWQFNRDLVYFWRVQVVVLEPNGNYRPISTEPAQVSHFYWAP